MIKLPQNTEEFLLNEEFSEYVRTGSKGKNKKWDEYLRDHPELYVEAEKAKSIIGGLFSFKDKLAEEEFNEFQLNQRFETTWKEYRENRSKNHFMKASRFVKKGLLAAAVIVFSVTIYSLLDHYVFTGGKDPEYYRVNVPFGKQCELFLPDGTKVWVNSGSEIRYSNRFNQDERDLHMSGEAYFEVTRNKKVPFRVLVNGAEVKVTGTRFNVKSYEGDTKVETVLVEGKIALSREDNEHSGFVELLPGDKAVFDLTTNKVIFSRKDVEADVAWKDGKIIYRNTPLNEVCKSLSRHFNADIQLHGDTHELLSHPFTFTVMNEPVTLVLEYLCKAAPLKFETEYIDADGEKGIEKTRYIISMK